MDPAMYAVEQLAPGSKVQIGGRDFHLSGLLGEGSFGAVWSATSPHLVGEVAIKEIICRSDVELGRATLEQQLLRFVGDALRDPASRHADSPAAAAARRFPSLVASEVQALAQDLWRVRIAMTRLPGRPLESLLEGALDGTRTAAEGSLAETCKCVRALLQQLVPALEHLSTRAHHRDITTRNILVEQRGGQYHFGLVDFGLAVDSARWKEDLLTHDIGGDGHYWPASSWFVLEYGAHQLAGFPGLMEEYEGSLDFHALGVTALRCLMELWVPEAVAAEARSTSAPPHWGQAAKLMRLRLVWCRFWEDIARFWQPIFDAFACGNCATLETLKSQYAHAGVHHMVSADICVVRCALRELRDAAVNEDLRVICEALLLLLRPGKKRDDVPTWRALRAALRGERLQRTPSPRRGPHGSAQMVGEVGKDRREVLFSVLHGDTGGKASCRAPGTSATTTQSTQSPHGSLWSSASVRSETAPMFGSKPLTLVHVTS